MSNTVISYPFGYKPNVVYYNIDEKTDDNENYHILPMVSKDFDIDNIKRIYESMITLRATVELEDENDELLGWRKDEIINNIVSFTNNFWMFAKLLTSLGNKIEIHKEYDSWCGDLIRSVTFNGERVFCPTEDYTNFIDYMRSQGITVNGVSDTSIVKYGSKEYTVAMWEQSIGDNDEKVRIKKEEIAEIEKYTAMWKLKLERFGWITDEIVESAKKFWDNTDALVTMEIQRDKDIIKFSYTLLKKGAEIKVITIKSLKEYKALLKNDGYGMVG